MPEDGARREEILDTAAAMFATSGIRTTLREIADGCGILPGSLYHHFESKEAIVVELVQRYRDDLDRVAKESLDSLHEPDQRPIEERVVELGEAIAGCAVQHRAALLLTLYEPPSVAGDELVELARQAPTAIDGAMFEILEAGRSSSAIRSDIDLRLLAERICQSMLHMGVGVYHRSRAAQHLPAEKCQVYLHGLVVRAPKRSLDRSRAMAVARETVASWAVDDAEDRSAHLRTVARAEFGRRGFEATTIRDIAKAAGTSTGSVYRSFPSKDELLIAIMQRYSEQAATSWDAVVAAPGSTIERLDALLWLNVNVVHHFRDEFKIAMASLRQSPPASADFGLAFGSQLRQLQELLTEGERAGDLRVIGSSAVARARSLFELMLTPEAVVDAAGIEGAHELARATILRGALVSP